MAVARPRRQQQQQAGGGEGPDLVTLPRSEHRERARARPLGGGAGAELGLAVDHHHPRPFVDLVVLQELSGVQLHDDRPSLRMGGQDGGLAGARPAGAKVVGVHARRRYPQSGGVNPGPGGQAGQVTGPRGIVELTLETADRTAMERFYVRVLGLETLDRQADRTWLKAGEDARLGLWCPGRKEFGDRGGRHVHFALSVPAGALDAIAAAARAAGVDAQGPVRHEGGDQSLYLRDPEGNVVEAWDYFEDGDGAKDGADGLAGS